MVITVNYYELFLKELEQNKKEKKKKKLLLHACCAPCSSAVLELLNAYFDITIFYYNPNISPKEEYEKRIEEEKKLLNTYPFERSVRLMVTPYDTRPFFQIAKGLEEEKERGKRCYLCYQLRLEETVKKAKEENFDYFATTLSISPYKNSDWLNEIGESLSKKYGVKYLYADFKKRNGYKRSIELSKEYGLYRQDYCGCIYSKIERDRRHS